MTIFDLGGQLSEADDCYLGQIFNFHVRPDVLEQAALKLRSVFIHQFVLRATIPTEVLENAKIFLQQAAVNLVCAAHRF
jgi:hypothetical protein